jgi:hypothetical protein
VHHHPGGKPDLALVLGSDTGPPLTVPLVPALAKIFQEGDGLWASRAERLQRSLGSALLRCIVIVEFSAL